MEIAGGRPPGEALQTAVYNNTPPVFANGSLHWLIGHKHWSVAGVADPAAAIIKFSVTDETFGFIHSLPFGTLGAMHLAKLDGCLCAVRDLRLGSPDNSSSMEIWKLKKDAWSLDTRIVFSQHTPMGLLQPSVLGAIVDDYRSARKIIIATSNHTVYAYDVRSSKVETIPSIAETDANYRNKRTAIRICLLKESLAPVRKTRQVCSVFR
jgi:hypothetical protein